jgi:uncharacterized protein YpiB (UPF0302 family)
MTYSVFKIYDQLKKIKFHEETNLILELIGNNLNRIDFVKDYVGLKDFVFLAEKKATEFEAPAFGCFNVDIIPGENQYNYTQMSQAFKFDLEEIFILIDDLFKTPDRKLYVGIGFKESAATSEDMLTVHRQLKNKEIHDVYQALAKYRKFPDWYNGKFPKDVEEEQDILSKLDSLNSQLEENELKRLYSEIDHALATNDRLLFQSLSKKLQKLQKPEKI